MQPGCDNFSIPLQPEGPRSSLSRTTMLMLAVTIHHLPEGMAIGVVLAALFVPMLPYLLAFAAGAMLYVVVEELIPEATSGQHTNLSTILFAVGFALMMVLDVLLE